MSEDFMYKADMLLSALDVILGLVVPFIIAVVMV